MDRTRTHRTPLSGDARERLALAERARGLLAEHSLPDAIALLILDHLDRRHADQLVGAREAGIPRRTWRRLIATGELRGCLVGREYLATRGDVDAYRRANVVRRCPGSSNNADVDALLATGMVQEAAE